MIDYKNIEELWLQFKSKTPYFIAEAGVNHLGDMELAEALIKGAKDGGADAIKFQSYKAATLTTKDAPRFWDWDGEDNKSGSQHDSYSTLDSFGQSEHAQLKNICEKYDIEFFSTPFDYDAIDYLEEIGVRMHKVASCDITNFPLLLKLAKTQKIILLSTGASSLKEITDAVNLISEYNNKIVVMHCNLKYPTADNEANLGMIKDLKKCFGDKYVIGLSDHTKNLLTPAFSYLLGANIFERHFTVDKTLGKSPDHSLVCVTPDEMLEMRKHTNKAIEMYGEEEKRSTDSEDRARLYARRSVVANSEIKKGEVFTEQNIACKRPGTGISPEKYFSIIGKTSTRDIKFDELLTDTDYN